jgi:hypothetical protein
MRLSLWGTIGLLGLSLVSGCSKTPTKPLGDVTPPASTTSLVTTTKTVSSITVNWNAPGNDGAVGTATSYDLRYSTSPITAGNFASASQVSGEPAPAVAGTVQSMIVTGLVANTTYYFAMKTSDEVPNTSALSDVATGATLGSYLLQWGSPGSGDSQFDDPHGIAIDLSGNVLVADLINHRIQKFTNTGTYLAQFGNTGLLTTGLLEAPNGVAVNASGDIYVMDSDDRVKVYTGSGTYITQWGSPGSGNSQFNNPFSLAVNAGGDVYVADYGNQRIQRFNSAGAYVGQWGGAGSGNGQFGVQSAIPYNGPYGIAVDGNGDIYVTDPANSRVQKFSATGSYITQWGSYGVGNSQFLDLGGISVDQYGKVYVVDPADECVQVFTNTGSFITRWGTPGYGNDQFQAPFGVAVDLSGFIYTSEAVNDRIQKFSPVP